jgi:hypothetical protein
MITGIIEVNGWRAIPRSDTGGYDISAPGGAYRGHAITKEAAEQWLDEASGAAYNRLPAVKKDELRVEVGPKVPIAQFPFRRNDFYQHTHYYYGDKRLGSIQYKVKRGKHGYLTLPHGTQSCTQGANLRWLLQQNSLRLVD